MSYIGAEPTTAAFPFNQFSGTGAATAFTLSQAPAGNTSVIVYVGGAVQNPNTYTIVGTTITFSVAPVAGTNNIGVLLLGLPALVGVPNVGTVTPAMLSTGGPSWNTGGTLSVAAITDSGNLAFTGTGNRITGDFSNGTVASRVAFQTSTANSNTSVSSIPNGTATGAAFNSHNNSDPTNSGVFQLLAISTEMRLNANTVGTGTYLPMTFYTGGSERVRIDTSGNVGIGTSVVRSKFASVSGTDNTAGGSDPSGFAGSFVSATGSAQASTLSIESNDTVAANTGGSIGFGGRYNSTSWAQWAKIGALKNNATSGDYGGALAFYTRANGGSNTEKMRINSSGNVGIGTNSPSYRLDVQTSDATNPAGYFYNTSGSSNSPALIARGGANNTGTARIIIAQDNSGNEEFGISGTGDLLFNSGYGSAVVAYGTRAWVNFDGRVDPTVTRASGNISSVGYNGIGDYTINFSSSFPDVNYIMAGSATEGFGGGNGSGIVVYDMGASALVLKTASACRINVSNNNADDNIDSPHVEVLFIR